MSEEEPMVEVKRMTSLKALSPDHVSTHVKLHGWVYSVRTQGAGTIVFVDLGDGTTVQPIRCIAEKPGEEGGEGEEKKDPKNQYNAAEASLLKNANDDEANYSGRLSFDELQQTSSLCLGCSVMIIGYVAEPPAGTTQTFEVKVKELFVIGGVEDAVKYPIQKSILKNPLSLRSHYHARFRAPLIQQLMLIRSQALFAIHEFFNQEGVPLLDPNIMTASDCEGAGEVFKVSPQFFTPPPKEEPKKGKGGKKGKKQKGGGDQNPNKQQPAAEEGKPEDAPAEAPKEGEEAAAAVETPAAATEADEPAAAADAEKKEEDPEAGNVVGLTVSSQLPLEAIAMGTGSVYTCQKSFRAEKSDTNKHLAEFIHVEYEQYFITLDDLLDQAERYVKHVVRTVLERCEEQYIFLNNKAYAPKEFHGHRDYLLSLLDKPFVRIKHSEAIDAMMQDVQDKVKTTNDQGKEVRLKFKERPTQGEDLGSEHEKYLVKKFGTFVFVTHWPSKIKSFYMKQVGDGTCESFDLLAPLVGELFGGSMREWRYNVLEEQMNSKDMDFAPLQWFVDLRKDGTAPHGGWGMGFDRLVMFLTNTASVRDIVPYPVYYGHCPY